MQPAGCNLIVLVGNTPTNDWKELPLLTNNNEGAWDTVFWGEDDVIPENTFHRATLDRAAAAINEFYPTANAGVIDCICCMEDFGTDLIAVEGDNDPWSVVNNVAVYNRLPYGTYLEQVGVGLVQLMRREARK